MFGGKKDKKEKKEKDDKKGDARPAPSQPVKAIKIDPTRMPDPKTVDQIFMRLVVDEWAIPVADQEQMLLMPTARKWELIVRDYKKNQMAGHSKDPGKVADSPQFYVDSLKLEPNRELLKKLYLALGSQKVAWLQQFHELQGTGLLLQVLKKLERVQQKTEKEISLLIECLRCLKRVMNNKIGMMSMIENRDAINELALCLGCAPVRVNVLELLSTVCMFEVNGHHPGHRAVMAAMQNFKEIKREKAMFVSLMEAFRQENDVEQLISIMAFFNVLINLHDDIDERVSVRKMLQEQGLDEVLKELRSEYELDTDLETQIDLYEDEALFDEDELKERFTDVEKEVDMTNPLRMLQYVLQQVADGPEKASVMALLTSLVACSRLKKKSDISIKSFTLIERFAQSIANQKKDITFGYEAGGGMAFKDLLNTVDDAAKVAILQNEMVQYKHLKEENALLKKELASAKRKRYKKEGGGGGDSDSDTFSSDDEDGYGGRRGGGLKSKRGGGDPNAPRVGGGGGGGGPGGGGGGWGEGPGMGGPGAPGGGPGSGGGYGPGGGGAGGPGGGGPGGPGGGGGGGGGGGDGSGGAGGGGGGGAGGEGAGSGAGGAGGSGPKPPGAPAGPKPPGAKPDGPSAAELAAKKAAKEAEANKPKGGDELGAPPPPPPPGADGPGGGPPPPPPPGGMARRPNAPPHLKGLPQPTSKMRMFNWVKISAMQAQNTIWVNPNMKTLLDLDFEEIESLFAANVVEPKAAADSGKKRIVTLIDGRKAQNLGIILGQLKLPNETIREAMLTLNEDLLDQQLAKQLCALAPTTEEMVAITAYAKASAEEPDENAVLGKCEQFFLETQDIPHMKERMACLQTKIKFPLKIAEIKRDIRIIYKATKEVMDSQKVFSIMELVLTLGNFLNAGTPRGNAWGFKVEGLLKLADIKSTKEKSLTFMHYLVKLIEKRFPLLLELPEEIPDIATASTLVMSQIMADLAELKKEVEEMRKEIGVINGGAVALPDGDKFMDVMPPFMRSAQADIKETSDRLERTKSKFSQLCKMYGEEATTNPEEFFMIWKKFLEAIDRAQKENEREKVMAERANKRNAARDKRLQEMAAKKAEQDDLVDDIMDKLRSGTVRALRSTPSKPSVMSMNFDDPSIDVSDGVSPAIPDLD